MPKTLNAFAFRDFDGKRILSRPYFRQWREKYHVGDKSDAEITSTLTAINSDSIDAVKKKSAALDELVTRVDKFHDFIIKRHYTRLENYRLACLQKSVDKPSRYLAGHIGRQQDLLKIYTVDVATPIRDLHTLLLILQAQKEKILSAAFVKLVGERIRRRRESLKITRQEMANCLHVSTVNAISLYENGKRELSILSLSRVAKLLNVTVDELITY